MTRAEKLVAALPSGIDAVLITDEKTGLYVTKFPASDFTLFVTRSKAYFFTDFRYIEAAEKAVEGCEVIMPTGRVSEYISKIISEQNIKTVGFEDDKMTVGTLERYRKVYPDVTFVGLGRLISDLCTLKDEEEFSKIRAAQKITDEAFSAVLTLIKPDMTEIDVAAELEYQMKKRGAIAPSFETIAVSGTNSARPHGVPRPVKLEKGFLTMDFGCVYDGYCSDMTRTVVIGRADDEMKKMYDTVLRAQLAAIDAAHEGMVCADLDKVARDIIDNAGYAGCFGHSLGHGVGLYIHELPRISAGNKDVRLEKGHVFTVEPGIYVKGKYGVRIEDMMFITSCGPEDITKSPKQLIEIC